MRGTGRIDIRFRLFVPNGGMRMIERSAYSYFRNEPDVMRVNDVARLLHCSKNTLYALIHDGRLMCLRLGRNMLIPKTALVEFIMCEKYYQVISPKASDNHWTSREKCDIVCRTNGRNTRKPAKRNRREVRKIFSPIFCTAFAPCALFFDGRASTTPAESLLLVGRLCAEKAGVP